MKLPYSNSIGGEHATCVNGNGSNPQMQDIYKVGELAGLSKAITREIAESVQEQVKTDLQEYVEDY